jgi:hypothetical protein
MANELREEIERYRMEHKPAAASLDSENDERMHHYQRRRTSITGLVL